MGVENFPSFFQGGVARAERVTGWFNQLGITNWLRRAPLRSGYELRMNEKL